MKIYILGASGFIGKQCADFFTKHGHDVVTERVDVTDLNTLTAVFRATLPDVVINCTGVRAYPTIDWCEDNKEETVMVNVVGAINVAHAALQVKAYPIQISTGCFYVGGKDVLFTEEDVPNFSGSFYSRMKIVMQNALKELPVLQVRIRLPLSMSYHPKNLITKIASYKKIVSVPNSVTLLEDMLPALNILIKSRPLGVLNLTNDGYIENKDILTLYKKIVDSSHQYEIITQEELELDITKAKRSNCILSNEKMHSLGISMPALTGERLEEILIHYKQTLP